MQNNEGNLLKLAGLTLCLMNKKRIDFVQIFAMVKDLCRLIT